MELLKIINLGLVKSNKVLLENINFTAQRGEITTIVGPNGAGKSSLLRSLCALDLSYSGELFLEGKSLRELSLKKRSKLIAWCPSSSYCSFPCSVYDFVMIGRFPWHQGQAKLSDHKKVLETLQLTRTLKYSKRDFNSLSDGEKKKVLLARTIAQETPLLFIDEICANLDIAQSVKIFNIFSDLAKSGRSICLSTHNLQLARQFSHNCLLISQGKQLSFGPCSQVLTEDNIAKAYNIRVKWTQVPEKNSILFVERLR